MISQTASAQRPSPSGSAASSASFGAASSSCRSWKAPLDLKRPTTEKTCLDLKTTHKYPHWLMGALATIDRRPSLVIFEAIRSAHSRLLALALGSGIKLLIHVCLTMFRMSIGSKPRHRIFGISKNHRCVNMRLWRGSK